LQRKQPKSVITRGLVLFAPSCCDNRGVNIASHERTCKRPRVLSGIVVLPRPTSHTADILTCFCHTRSAERRWCCVIQIKIAIYLAFAAGCLAVITTLSAAHAQMSYWPPPGPYGYGPPPGAYGPPPGAYGPAPGTYAPQSQYVPPSAGTQVITTARRPTQATFRHPGRHNAMSWRANSTTGCSRETRPSARHVSVRNAVQLPTHNFIGIASTALRSTKSSRSQPFRRDKSDTNAHAPERCRLRIQYRKLFGARIARSGAQ